MRWSVANVSTIDCTTGGYRDANDAGFKIQVYAPLLKKNYTSEGYLCIKTELITECSENFFGGQTIKYYSNSVSVSPSECSEAIFKWLTGDLKMREHPAPSCSWMRSSSEQSIYIEIRQHPVLFDPYTNNKISDLFIKGQCNQASCETTREGVLWMSYDNHLPQCFKEILSPIYIFAQEKENKHYEFWSPDYPLRSAKRLCIKEFCGMRGFMFDDGTWIGVKKEDIPPQDKLGEYLYKLERCEHHSQISIQPEEIMMQEVEHTVFGLFMRRECEKTKERLLKGDIVSRIELQTLTPRSPGRHYVYRILNNTLLQSISDYQWVRVKESPHKPYVSFQTETGHNIEWSYWSFNKILNITDGPNGLYVRGKTLVYPGKTISDYEHHLQHSIKQRIGIDHNELILSHQSLRHHIVLFPHFNDTSITDIVSNTFSFKFWASHGFMTFIIILFLFSFMKILHRLVTKRGENIVRYNPANPENHIKIYDP